MKRLSVFLSLIFFALIFHEKVMEGTASGLLIWYRSLIPALLPFILITNALTETRSYDVLADSFQKRIPGIYKYTAILLGNLCGYPIGAKILNDFVKSGKISNKEANNILSFSSQASPMFLLGFVYPLLPKDTLSIPVFLSVLYIPSVVFYFISANNLSEVKIVDTKYNNNNTKDFSVTDTFMQTIRILVIIGVYVIIFSIFTTILSSLVHHNAAKCFLSFLEITNGLTLINSINLKNRINTCLILALTSFGGLCTAFQIRGVLTYEEASIKKYLLDKAILSAGTFFLTYIYLLIN